MRDFILNFSCADRPGIVASVTAALFRLGANIEDSAQFRDRGTGAFFMRIAFTTPDHVDAARLEAALADCVAEFGMAMTIKDQAALPRVIIMASHFDHALLHLLYQLRVGWLRAEIVGIVSNHETTRPIAEAAGLPYFFWPVGPANRAEQEDKLLQLVRQSGADLVVLARYMQILSDRAAAALQGRAINIHHSFLPSFKGAKPYHQAFDRGVKLIGATAHYVTADLDEGPIIEQETERVSHAMAAEDLVAAGRDIESRVLARAVKHHLESRVMLNGRKTIVF